MKISKVFNHENTKFLKHEIVLFRVSTFSCFRGEAFAFYANHLQASTGVEPC